MEITGFFVCLFHFFFNWQNDTKVYLESDITRITKKKHVKMKISSKRYLVLPDTKTF